MKNKKSILLKISFILGISLFSHITYPISVYLENNYGETLNYKTSSTDATGKNIGTNVRVLLGDIHSVAGLWIRTTSIISSYFSSYYDFTRFLDDIRSQQRQHPNDDAIIAIDRTGTKQWNPNLRWEAQGTNIILFDPLTGAPKVNPNIPEPIQAPSYMINYEQEEALMDLPTADQRLDAIRKGTLGMEYATKTTEICSANYTQAEKLGKINLCAELKRNLVAPIYRIDKRARKKPGFVSPDLAPAIADIKANINLLHGALARYKARGEAS
jgi:hypothetical protein